MAWFSTAKTHTILRAAAGTAILPTERSTTPVATAVVVVSAAASIVIAVAVAASEAVPRAVLIAPLLTAWGRRHLPLKSIDFLRQATDFVLHLFQAVVQLRSDGL